MCHLACTERYINLLHCTVLKHTMRAFDGGRRRWSCTIKHTYLIDGELMRFFNLSEQHCLLLLPLGGCANLTVNDCAARRSTCGSRRARCRAGPTWCAAFNNQWECASNIGYVLWESIRNKITNKIIIFGRLEGSRNTIRGFWACFRETSKRRCKNFLSAGRAGLRLWFL